MNTRFAASFAALVAVALPLASAHAAPQNKMTGHGKAAVGHKMMAHGVYVCKECKTYMHAGMAKKMGYKDAMGHKMMKMDKVPAGYKNAGKMGDKMKMGKMNDDKMEKKTADKM